MVKKKQYPEFPNFPEGEVPYGYVYRIVNTVTEKTYVGQRKFSLDIHWHSYWGSGVRLRKLFSKYGQQGFSKELIVYAYSFDELNELEEKYILEEKALGKGQYNLLLGPARMSKFEKSVHVKNALKRVEKNSRKYNLIFKEIGSEVISYYLETQHINKTALRFNLPRNRVREFLLDSEIELNSQTEKGKTQSAEKREAIRKGGQERFYRTLRVCDECVDKLMSKCPEGLCDECRVKLRKSSRGAVPKDCLFCKKVFLDEGKNRSFCSLECRERSFIRRISPEKYLEAKKMFSVQKLSMRTISEKLEIDRKELSRMMKKDGVLIPYKNSPR